MITLSLRKKLLQKKNKKENLFYTEWIQQTVYTQILHILFKISMLLYIQIKNHHFLSQEKNKVWKIFSNLLVWRMFLLIEAQWLDHLFLHQILPIHLFISVKSINLKIHLILKENIISIFLFNNNYNNNHNSNHMILKINF